MGIFLDNIAAAPVPNKFINKPIKRITTGFNAYKQTFFDFLRTDKENDIQESQLLSKSCSYNRDRCFEHKLHHPQTPIPMWTVVILLGKMTF